MKEKCIMERHLPINIVIGTNDKSASATIFAVTTVTSMPTSANPVADLPSGLIFADGYDIADNFVSWDAR